MGALTKYELFSHSWLQSSDLSSHFSAGNSHSHQTEIKSTAQVDSIHIFFFFKLLCFLMQRVFVFVFLMQMHKVVSYQHILVR